MVLKIIQVVRKSLDFGIRRQVRRRGTQGIRKRASWWGKMERRVVAERAEMRREFCQIWLRAR